MSSKLVLVLNCGSSSLKFAIIDAVNGEEYLSGLAECFHLPEARIKWKMDGNKQEAALGAGAAHSEALNFIVNTILAQKPELSAQMTAIGHRIVHGGEKSQSGRSASGTSGVTRWPGYSSGKSVGAVCLSIECR